MLRINWELRYAVFIYLCYCKTEDLSRNVDLELFTIISPMNITNLCFFFYLFFSFHVFCFDDRNITGKSMVILIFLDKLRFCQYSMLRRTVVSITCWQNLNDAQMVVLTNKCWIRRYMFLQQIWNILLIFGDGTNKDRLFLPKLGIEGLHTSSYLENDLDVRAYSRGRCLLSRMQLVYFLTRSKRKLILTHKDALGSVYHLACSVTAQLFLRWNKV